MELREQVDNIQVQLMEKVILYEIVYLQHIEDKNNLCLMLN